MKNFLLEERIIQFIVRSRVLILNKVRKNHKKGVDDVIVFEISNEHIMVHRKN